MVRTVLVVIGAAVVAAGCGREAPFPDRMARVEVGDESLTFAVDACGLDGETAYVVGRADDGRVVQAVIGVGPDGTTGVPTSTGLTVTGTDGTGVAAFGPEAWARRGREGDPPGAIASARIRGARIQARGEARPVDDQDRPRPGPPVEVAFDARCDDQDGG